MVMGGGVTSQLGVILSLDDRFSAPMAGVTARTRTAGQTFLAATPRLATFGSSMTGLLIATGALDNKMGRMVTSTLAFSSAFVSAIPAIQSLISVTRMLNKEHQLSIGIQRVLQATHLQTAQTATIAATAGAGAAGAGAAGAGARIGAVGLAGAGPLGLLAVATLGAAWWSRPWRATADRPQQSNVTVVTNLDGRQVARTVSQYQERDRLVGRVSGSR